MNIQTDHYSFELPDQHADDIIAGIADEMARQSILDAIEGTDDGEPVRLSVGLADTLLNALSEWEREGEDEAAAQIAEWNAIEAEAAREIEEFERPGGETP